MGISKFKQHEKNPYISGLKFKNVSKLQEIKTSKLDPGDEYKIINTKTDQMMPLQLFLKKKKIVDPAKFVKLYVNNASMFFELNTEGKKVLQYIIERLEMNSGEIYLDKKDIGEKMYNNKNNVVSVYRGIEELLNRDLIQRSDNPYKFYINPDVFFNGDRTVMFGVELELDKLYNNEVTENK